MSDESRRSTANAQYTERLRRLSGRRWKTLIPTGANPYLRNVRRLCVGATLDVGCGIGRYLRELPPGSVGVDHNATSVQHCRDLGLTALTTEEFADWHASDGRRFDTILMSHLLEHVSEEQGDAIAAAYLPTLRSGGRIVLICPQERGYRSDATHVRFVDDAVLADTARRWGGSQIKVRSFPLPRWAGERYIYNEFVATATV